MLSGAYIYRSPGEIAGIFDTLFGGVFFAKGIPLITQLAILAGFSFSLLCAVRFTKTGSRAAERAALASTLFLFLLIVLLLLQPWDELFINLRHSFNFAHGDTFSFNATQKLEGTVDFLPYFLIGCLAKVGVPVVECAFILSFLGGVALLFCIRSLLQSWGYERAALWAFVLAPWYPPLSFNSAQGFSTTVFCATTFWTTRWLFFSSRKGLGLALLSVIPLIRIEGALLVALFLVLHLIEHPKPRKQILHAFLVFLPMIALSLWRHWYFGSFIPLPIQFKSSVGSLFFLLVGVRNWFADAASSYALLGLSAIAYTWAAHTASLHEIFGDLPTPLRRAMGIAGAIFIFTLPYYISGGDWFPSYWGRYFFPLGMFITFTFPLCLWEVSRIQSPSFQRGLAATLLLVFCVHTLWPISSFSKMAEGVFTNRRILAKLFDKKTGRGHYRIQHLSQLGNHLRQTTLPTQVIASSEIATIMFFAQRETMDMLGLVNPEIIASPLRPPPALFRRFPVESELPFLIFKRLKPGILKEAKPEFVYTFDFILRDLMEGIPFEEIDDRAVFTALSRWDYNLKGLVEPLYGGVEELERLGYRAIVVFYHNAFASLYFVSSTALPGHLETLHRQGFLGAWNPSPPR